MFYVVILTILVMR